MKKVITCGRRGGSLAKGFRTSRPAGPAVRTIAKKWKKSSHHSFLVMKARESMRRKKGE